MGDCLFCKIRDGEIPGEIVYENEHVMAFNDINPTAPTHILIIPKEHISTLNDLEEDHKQEHEPQQHEREDALLAAMHAWTYVGLLKMGLLCAVLMDNGGHAKKREVMRKRGPVLLHRGFLLAAQGVLRQAAVAGSPAQEELIDKGLFFVAEDAWQRGQREKL